MLISMFEALFHVVALDKGSDAANSHYQSCDMAFSRHSWYQTFHYFDSFHDLESCPELIAQEDRLDVPYLMA